jgi:S-adenosylmethionine:tRNA ribosyltransferase-isomerase
MRTADFDFQLPPELIAQTPAPSRDQSRLLVLDRASGELLHRQFDMLKAYLRAGDVLVLNDSRVIPARLRGVNEKTGGQFELLLLEENSRNDWWAMMRPGKRARAGTQIRLLDLAGAPTDIQATVLEHNAEGHRRLHLAGASDILSVLEQIGEVPLPPYIRREAHSQDLTDRERYQTVFAKPPGSVAAPTAGLHFTESLLNDLRGQGVWVCYVTLHVGLGTFAPVKEAELTAHTMHQERYEVEQITADRINQAKGEKRRILGVGTTTVRVLETLAVEKGGRLAAAKGKTRIFIYPPYRFQIVDMLLSNFHLPCSTLLMLVSAFAAPGELRGREMVLSAYGEAIRKRYRFFSYGDAMLLV